MDNNDDNKTIKLGLNLEPDSDTKSGKTQPSKINNNNNNTSSNKPAQKTDEKSHLSKNKDDENSTVNFS